MTRQSNANRRLGTECVAKCQCEGGVTYTYNSTAKITSITANCVAKVVYDGNTANVWTFFVAPDGTRFYYNNNNPGGFVENSGREDRISPGLLVN